MTVTTAVILDFRNKSKQTKNYPVALRVTYLRQSRAYPLGPEMSKSDFRKLFSPRSAPHLGEKLRETKEKLEKEEQRAQKIIKNINNFSFPVFYQEFSAFRPGARPRASRAAKATLPSPAMANVCGPKPEATAEYLRKFKGNQFGKERKYPRKKSEIDFLTLGEVAFYYGEYIKELEAMDCVGTVSNYMCSLNSLLTFRGNLRFLDMTKLELLRYEKWMEKRGHSVTTISMYLRAFRKIYRMAMARHVVPIDSYPFGLGGYVIPTGLNVKKARPIDQIQLLFNYISDDPAKMMARDYWILSYLGNGMNPKDIALLKTKLIQDNFIRFKRAKTIRTTKANPQQIAVYMLDEIKAIIQRQGRPGRDAGGYLFPIITDEMDAYEQDYQVELFRKLVNARLELICREDLKISPAIKFEDARHCAATQLKRSGVDMEFIREFLGHKDLRTTMNYLDSFVDETKIEQAGKLVPFLNAPNVGQALKAVSSDKSPLNQEAI